MTWYPKYRSEWAEINGSQWKVDIEDIVNPGSITALIASGDPVNIEFLSNEDELHQSPVKGSKAVVKVKCLTDFVYRDLYAIQDQDYRVSIYLSNVLLWQGFVFADMYSEPYDCVPYEVSISASDQLGILKNIQFENAADYYAGRKRISAVLLDIFSMINIIQFTEYVNLYEVGMDDGVTDSPFDQTEIDTYLFRDWSCYDILAEILKSFNAIIRNIAGKMIIYRPVELSQTTVYGRIFTGETAKTGTSITPQQLINRIGSTSGFRDVNGGTLMAKGPAREIKTIVDPGSKDSWIKNWDILRDTATGSLAFGYTWQFWSEYGNCDPRPLDEFLKEEKGGFLMTGHNAYPTMDTYMYQVFGYNALLTRPSPLKNHYKIEFEYLLYNLSGADKTGQAVKISIVSNNNDPLYGMPWYLFQPNAATKTFDPVSNNVLISYDDTRPCIWSLLLEHSIMSFTDDAPIQTSGWHSFSAVINTLPINGSYTIKLFASSAGEPNICVAFKNIKFYAVSDNVNLITSPIRDITQKTVKLVRNLVSFKPKNIDITYKKTNTLNGKSISCNLLCGDVINYNVTNIIEQFAGALARVTSNETLAQSVIRFVSNNSGMFWDLILTYSGTNLLFTAEVPGTDFVSSLGITNLTGDVTGSISTLIANSPGTAQIDQVTLVSGSGLTDITIGNVTETMAYYGSGFDDTIDHFISLFASSFSGYLLTRSGTDILQIEEILWRIGNGFTTTCVDSGLVTSVSTTQATIGAIARIDQIAMSGTSGTASITYNISTYLFDIAVGEILTPTIAWHIRGGSENKPLHEVITDEIANQMSRTRDMIAGWPIREGDRVDATPQLNLIDRVEDALDIDPDTSDPRMFVFNRGLFNGKTREWNADFIEIL